MRIDEIKKMIKTGKEILEAKQLDTKRADEMAEAKWNHIHNDVDTLEDGCPINRFITSGCFDCTHTDRIGFCCYPVDIQTEIAEGRARPMINDYDWPERAADYERRLKRLA